MKRMGTDSQATTVSMARHGPLNYDVKSGVVVACMAWITPPMAQAGEPADPLGDRMSDPADDVLADATQRVEE